MILKKIKTIKIIIESEKMRLTINDVLLIIENIRNALLVK